MSLHVVNGKARREGAERRRISHIAIAPATGEIQLISGMLEVQRIERPNMPPAFQGPIRTAWADVCALHPDATKDLLYLGALIATPEGQFRGQIDWVKATDAVVIENNHTAPDQPQQ